MEKPDNIETQKEKEQETARREIGFFDKESILSRILITIGSIILANILFLICCLPVITIGASLTALIRVCLLINDKADFNLTKEFFTTFARNFLDATVGWLLFGSLAAGSGLMVYMNALKEGGNTAFVIIFGIIAFLALLELTFYFAMVTRYDNTIFNQMKNALLVGIANVFKAIWIWIIWAVPIAAFAISLELVRYLGWIWLAAGFAMFMIVTCRVYSSIFTKLEKTDDKKNIENTEAK